MKTESQKLMSKAQTKFVPKILADHNYTGEEILENSATGYRDSAKNWAIDAFDNIHGYGCIGWISIENEGKSPEEILHDLFNSLIVISDKHKK